MYQTEANRAIEPLDQLPRREIARFSELQGALLSRTILPWGEHCTECVWPTCYTSCDLYTPRLDGGCRRFVDGMVRIDCPEAVNGYLLKIRFKQWGKLWTPGNLNLIPMDEARRRENRDYRFSSMLHSLPLSTRTTGSLIQRRYSYKKRAALRSRPDGSPSALLLECYNPSEQTIPLSFTLRSMRQESRIPFQKLIPLSPGLRRVRIPVSDITQVVDLASPFSMELLPADGTQDSTLFFGLMDFVEELAPVQDDRAPVKCVVWDLDNTLWDGVLTEHGRSSLRLKPQIVEILASLDRRGILQSIASKNNHDSAMDALAGFHLDHFFLYPQVSWAPKSSAIKTIAQELNIGLDAILFVDDSEFELAEVRSSCPAVRCLHAREYDTVLDLQSCQLPVTEESTRRRRLYQVDKERKHAAAIFKHDYKAFLKHCNIILTITTLDAANLDRVHELTQRTNQMNFSGTRYRRDLLQAMLNQAQTDTYVLRCEDQFGSYGVVGFAVVDRREPRLTDLMFSCRIQAKRIEHAFLGYILGIYLQAGSSDFYASYRKTPRNEASGQVFADLGMLETSVHDGVTSLVFPRHMPIPDDGIVSIHVERENRPAEQLV